jgi:hypothetical protein
MRKAALATYVLLLVLFAALIARPYLRTQHDTPAEVPSPTPLVATSLDVMQPGQRLCMTDVAISRQSRQVRFRAGSYGKPGPPLRVTVRAPGYTSAAAVRGGWEDNVVQALPLRAPPRDQLVTVCIRNTGHRKIALYAADDSAHSRVNVFLDGQRIGPTPELSFWEGRARSIAQNADVTAQRIATFRGIFDHTWIVWTLAVLFALGLPVLVGVGLWAALRDA